jgi:hypothetical protein
MKLNIAIIALWLAFFHCRAQNHFGIKAGMNLNDLTTTGSPFQSMMGYNATFGGHIGIFYSLVLSEKFSLIPELQYTLKGGAFEIAGHEQFATRIGYLELPLMLSYHATKRLSLDIGGYGGYKITYESVWTDYYENFDAGILAGVRFSLNKKWGIVSRYNFGLTPIMLRYFRDVNGYTYPAMKEHTRSLQLGVTYSFRKHGE